MKLFYYVRTARRPLSALKFVPADSLLYFQVGALVPPAPAPAPTPAASATGGGVGLAHPRRLPYWDRRVTVGSASLVAPPALVSAWGRVEEDELTGEENQFLDLL